MPLENVASTIHGQQCQVEAHEDGYPRHLPEERIKYAYGDALIELIKSSWRPLWFRIKSHVKTVA